MRLPCAIDDRLHTKLDGMASREARVPGVPGGSGVADRRYGAMSGLHSNRGAHRGASWSAWSTSNARHALVVLGMFLGSIGWMVSFRSVDVDVTSVTSVPLTTTASLTPQATVTKATTATIKTTKTTKTPAKSTTTNTPLLLLSHGRMMWYDLETGSIDVVDSGHGVYYGGFVLDATGDDLYYVSRPHNWRADPDAKEYLVNGATGARWELPTKFTHDAVAHGGRVYVADTENGRIVEVDGDRAVGEVLGAHELFTAREHVNTLSVDVEDSRYVWAMLHNLGPSMLAKVDLGARPARVVERIQGVGKSSHGAVQYEVGGRRKIVFLDSNEVALGMVDVERASVDIFYTLQDSLPDQAFLKGLCIVDDIAFFGVAPSSPRASRTDDGLECELAAYDLLNGKLLFRKRMPTHGLLNVVSAPLLAADSTQRALRTPDARYRRALLGDPGMLQSALARFSGVKELNVDTNASWSSGWPRLDNRRKNMREGFAGGTQLILYRKDLSALRRRLESISPEQYDEEYQSKHNAWIGKRDDVLQAFKPGTKAFHLIFSGREGHGVFQFPWYDKFADLLEPLLEELLGDQTSHIMRAQFALMPAHTEIKPHVDSGGYSTRGHRIHFVVQSNPDVHFNVCQEADDCIRLNTEEGLVYELNNRLKHWVKNDSDEDRIHLVVDVAEEPRERTLLRVGQVCQYERGSIVC